MANVKEEMIKRLLVELRELTGTPLNLGYEPLVPRGNGLITNVGFIDADYNKVHGGWRIYRITNQQGAETHLPGFPQYRVGASEFCHILKAAVTWYKLGVQVDCPWR